MVQNLGKSVKFDIIQIGIAAGQTDPDSDSVDMANFESVLLIGIIGVQTATGVAVLTAEGSTDDSTFAAITGAVVTAPANSDDKLLMIDLVKPLDRYIRTSLALTVDNTTWGGTLAMQYNGRKPPFTHADLAVAMATVIGGT